jgi:hypothetical protein
MPKYTPVKYYKNMQPPQPEITLLLKRSDFEENLMFENYFQNGRFKFISPISANVFPFAFPDGYSRGIVRIANTTFISDPPSLLPIVERFHDDGTCDFYLSQYGIRITEIGLQNSLTPLVVEILPNGTFTSYYLHFPTFMRFFLDTNCNQIQSLVVDVNNLDTVIKKGILIDIITDIQCGTKSEGCKSTNLPFMRWSSEFEKFIKKESGVLYYKSIDYMTSTETVLKVKMDSFSSNIDNLTCIDESNGSETTCPVLTSMKFLLKKTPF